MAADSESPDRESEASTWDPQAYRRRLARLLREFRELSGRTQASVTTAMFWSPSKIIRVEAGTVAVTPNDVRALLDFYGVDDKTRVSELVELAKAAKSRSPLDRYKRYISQEFYSYLAFETSASAIRNFECLLVPGLLQTQAYADAVLNEIRAVRNAQRIDRLVELRLDRQERLLSRSDLRLAFMLDESILRRPVGGPEVMKGELEHLLEISTRPNVELKVVPFSAGVYRGLRLPFVVLEFPDPIDPPVLFIEYPDGDRILQGDEVLETKAGRLEGSPPDGAEVYLETYFELEGLAAKDSTALIQDALEALS